MTIERELQGETVMLDERAWKRAIAEHVAGYLGLEKVSFKFNVQVIEARDEKDGVKRSRAYVTITPLALSREPPADP